MLFEDKRVKEGLKAIASKEAEQKRQAEEAAAAEQEFSNLVSEGNQLQEGNEPAKAIAKFELALEIRDDPEIRGKIDELKGKVSAQEQEKARAQAEAEKQKEYEDIIAKADKAFGVADYDKARSLYQNAAQLTSEDYPTSKLDEIQKILDEKVAEEQAALDAEAASKKAAEEAAAKKAAEDEATKKLAEEEAKRLAEQKAANESAEEEAKRVAEQEAQRLAAQEEAKKAAAENAARKAAEEEAKRLAAEEAARNSQKEQQSQEDEMATAYSKLMEEGQSLFQGNKLEQARDKFAEAMSYKPGDDNAKGKILQINAILDKQEEAKRLAEEAAKAASTPAKSPEAEKQVTPETGTVILGDVRVGEEASLTARLSEDEKFDGMMRRAEIQQEEFYEDQEQKQLRDEYPRRKTVETEEAGNSVITWVYINYGEFVTIYKRVKHNWGGEYFFIDGQATNRRYWEHETQ